jgi:hypothetical protein
MFGTLFKSKLTQYKEKFEALREPYFWAFDSIWNQAIDSAIATNDGDYLETLYDTLVYAINETPKQFPLWFILPVPREIEDLFTQTVRKNKKLDHKTLHWSLEGMTSEDQEKVVKALIEFWHEKSPQDVPIESIKWATGKEQIVQREVIPYGAIANIPVYNSVAPKFSISDPDSENTDFVKKILLKRSKVRFIGEEGSGKTSKARWLCRERMALGHQIYWINPHLKADDKAKLEACNVTIVGGGRNYEAIANFCTRMAIGDKSELSKQYKRYGEEVGAEFAPVTIVLDELTNYKEEVGEPIEKLIKASMQEFSKINWHTIYVAHNDTLACMGAPAGTANLIKSSVFDLKLEADATKGNRIPKAIAKYRMPNSDNWQDVTIPTDWQ